MKAIKRRYYKTARNLERAERARQAMEQYDDGDCQLRAGKEGAAELLTDLLCDMMHFARQNKIDFADQLRKGQDHFEVEASDMTGMQ